MLLVKICEAIFLFQLPHWIISHNASTLAYPLPVPLVWLHLDIRLDVRSPREPTKQLIGPKVTRGVDAVGDRGVAPLQHHSQKNIIQHMPLPQFSALLQQSLSIRPRRQKTPSLERKFTFNEYGSDWMVHSESSPQSLLLKFFLCQGFRY